MSSAFCYLLNNTAMKNFVVNLKKDVDKKIRQIESEDNSMLKKALNASHILGEAFDKLKEFIVSYQFKGEEEEIAFFKEIKPKMFCHLIYYRKVYNIELDRPAASIELQKSYLSNQLEYIDRYLSRRLDFLRYYRTGATYLDALYFLRGQSDNEQYLETFYYELDPEFSTNRDLTVAKILANDMLSAYLMSELEILEYKSAKHTGGSFPATKLTWQATKTDLYELLYALDSKNVFGNVPLTQLADYIQSVFNIELDSNMSRTFCDMKIRNNKTPFLDGLKEVLLERMNTINNKRSKK